MVQTCSAYNCSERANKGNSNYAFHRFPVKNKGLLRAWCLATRRKDFHPQLHNRICSKHFTPDSYKKGFGLRKLRKNAIPTLFDFGEKKQSKRKRKGGKSATATYKKFISSKPETKNSKDDETIGNYNSTSENESRQEERVVEVIKLENYKNIEPKKEYDSENETAMDLDKNCVEDKQSKISETISNNENIAQICNVTADMSHQVLIENEKLRHTISLMHKKIEKFKFLIECLQSADMISKEAAFVLRSTMEM